MNWRKKLSIFVAAVLTAGMLAGCAGGGGISTEEGAVGTNSVSDADEMNTEDGAKGRYVEEEVEVPWKESDMFLCSNQEADGALQILMMDSESGEIIQYTYKEGWEQEKCEWLTDISNQGKIIHLLSNGEDGKQYAFVYDEEQEEEQEDVEDISKEQAIELEPISWHLYCHSDERTEELFLPVFSEEAQKSQMFFPYYLGVSESGDFAIVNPGNDDIVVYSRQDGKQRAEFPNHEMMSSMDKMYLMDGNRLLTLAESRKEIVIYNIETGEEENRLEIGTQKSGCLAGTDGKYHLVNMDGIWNFSDEGSIIEQVFDGSLGTMSSASKQILGFHAKEDEEFYVIYGTEGVANAELCHYVYDSEALVVPPQTLHVYGLRESSKITEAVHVFQKENPDVKVVYEYAFGEFAPGETEDTIKALNTELLGGQGADVLVLDELPADSYVEKGVLADISSFGEKLQQENKILKKVLEGSKEDGALYMVPTGMYVPVMFGTEELCSAVESLDGLETYLQKNETSIVTGVNPYSKIAWMLFGMNYEKLMEEDGSVNQESVVRILKLAKKIGENNPKEWMEQMQKEWEETRAGSEWSAYGGNAFSLTSCESYYDTGCVGIRSLNSMIQAAEICDIMKSVQVQLKNIKGYYIPNDVLGINQNSEKKELAEAFIETVLSNEVQTAVEMDLPVCPESLDKLGEISESKKDYTMGTSNWDGKMHTYGYPTAEEAKEFVELFKQVEKPMTIDHTVQEAFLDAADRYFAGEITEEEAAQEMARMVDTYMAE